VQRLVRLLAILGVAALCLVGGHSAIASNGDSSEETSIRELASYALGRNIAALILDEGFDIDETMLVQGISDVLNGQASLFEIDRLEQALVAFHEERNRRLMEQEAAWNLEFATEFLAANGEREGVYTTETGLQYEILEQGTGSSPTFDDTVKVHYHGMFADGTEFDSSYRRGVPSTFALSDVIAGWSEALRLMQVGAVWRIFVPPHLAYGEQGAGPIGPNELLIFGIELLAIEDGVQ